MIGNSKTKVQKDKTFTARVRRFLIRRESSWWLRIVLLVAGISSLALIGYGAGNAFNAELEKPLGPTLVPYPSISQSITNPVGNLDPPPNSDLELGAPASSSESSPLFQEVEDLDPTVEPLCGGPPAMIVLVAGADTSDPNIMGNSDIIRAVRINFTVPSITSLAFPRDLWVTIPGLDDLGITEGKVNSAFAYGNAYRTPGEGPSILAQTLFLNFGLRVDHYVALNTAIFEDVVDKLGGIDMHLTGYIDGTTFGMNYSPTGWYHFNGEQALAFVSIRMPDSDWHRIGRQSQAALAVKEKVMQPENLVKIPALIDSFFDHVLTDLSVKEISRLSCLLPKLQEDAIHSFTIDREFVTAGMNANGLYVMIPHEEDIRALVDDFQWGRMDEEGY